MQEQKRECMVEKKIIILEQIQHRSTALQPVSFKIVYTTRYVSFWNLLMR